MASLRLVGAALLHVLLILHLTTSAWASVDSSSDEEESHVRAERAIGGRGIQRGTYPWLVLLRATIVTRRFLGIPLDHYHLYCGAVLIHPRWLLTAAHCFTEHGARSRQASNWEARMATSRIRPTIGQRLTDLLGRVINHDDFRQWEIDAERIILHPGYNADDPDINHDIALVKLERSAPNVDAVRPISLPNYSGGAFPRPGADCVMAGWGCTRRGGSPSTWAQHVTMPVVSPYGCQRLYGMNSMQNRICAGHLQSGIGVCMGDSGGPLVCRTNSSTTTTAASNRNNDDLILAGIVSFTSADRPESFPAVFTKVQSYTPWITSTMNQN